jgi:RND family efflux transporter MFP subunit
MIVTAVVLLLAVVTGSCKKSEQPAPEPVIRPVRYQQVSSIGGTRVRSFSGAAKASAEIQLSFKVTGTLSRLPVNVGDFVKENTVIAELDPRDYELQVEDDQAALAQTRAQGRNAAADYERVRGLYENNNASKADLDAARTAAESADAKVRSMEKKLELARLQLSYTKLASPVDGAVAEVRAEVNENLSAAQTILTLHSGSRPEVEVTVPEALITQILRGSRVTVKFDALAGRTFSAMVTEVGVAPTGSATTFPVTVLLDRAAPKILPGMSAEVAFTFTTEGGSRRFVVPPQSVGGDPEGHFVYTLERGQEGLGVVRRRSVRIGELVTEGLEILEGLRDGDLVVTAGVSRIEEGQTVKLLESNQS